VPSFRRVEARQAGPAALGILVPPGSRTLVILRPRGLAFDLLPALWDGNESASPAFCTFGRDEAATVARRVPQKLEQASDNPVQTVGDSRDESFQVWVRIEPHVWIVCQRAPGSPYRPLVFAERDEARLLAEQLTPIFWPATDAVQEFYFNTQHFA
jgi:hypothetical protein